MRWVPAIDSQARDLLFQQAQSEYFRLAQRLHREALGATEMLGLHIFGYSILRCAT
jgi:hypothetical protein